jgi:23S rRNA-/tRNA-specific pseudouridylate synthase
MIVHIAQCGRKPALLSTLLDSTRMHSVRNYAPLPATASSASSPPGVNFTLDDMREWLSFENYERVRSIQSSGSGQEHGHLRHCVCAETSELGILEAMERYFGVPEDIGRMLIGFGSVHWARIPPEIPGYVPSDRERHGEARRKAKEQVMQQGELKGLCQAKQSRILLSKTDRILDAGFVVRPYSYIRAHLWPKRFPMFHSVDWKDRIVAQGAEYIIINKPNGVPVPPTVDNIRENVVAGAASALNVEYDSLHITTRIDQATEGLVVLGKKKAFVSKFNGSIRNNAAKKWYRAAVCVPEGFDAERLLGDVKHQALVKFKAPDTPYITLVLDGLRMDDDTFNATKDTKGVTERKNVVDCHMVICSATLLEQHRIQGVNKVLELVIELITGRTHQIRCQLSALGLPIVGDDLYRPLADKDLRSELFTDPRSFKNVRSDGSRILSEAEGAIGLQAYRLEFGDGAKEVFADQEGENVVFEAGAPWWRSN